MRNIIIALLISFSCIGQGNLIVREIFGGKSLDVFYTGNIGKDVALIGGGTGQAAAGLYPVTSAGLSMSSDGTRVYGMNHNGNSQGFTQDAVSQFNLSTPWDLTTMSGIAASTASLNSFPSYYEDGPRGICFSPDGLNLYVAGGGTRRIFRYTLSTAWELSTSSPHSSQFTGFTYIAGLSFSTDGTKMFVTESSNVLKRFTLSTAWDILTATIDAGSISIADGNIHFNSDGMSFYSNGAYLTKYYLTTAWDLNSYLKSINSVNISTLVVTSGFQGIYIDPLQQYFFRSFYTVSGLKRFEINN
jgi:DNA-binding beta-propeller fold protein YncE